nr:hypothetical protein TetV2_00096 [Oceanusvirus sp.]
MLSRAKTSTLVVKIVRFIFIWFAIRIATKLHEAKYVELVYGKGEKPPSMNSVLLNLGIMLVLFHVALLAFIHTAVTADLLPRSSLTYAATESGVYIAVTMGMAAWIASLVQSKKYFNYKKDGIRAIRAYKEILLWTIFPLSASPIFFTT